MGLKEKPKNIIYDFYDIDQNGKPGDSPLPFLGAALKMGKFGMGAIKKLKGDPQGPNEKSLSGGRREAMDGGMRGISAEAARAGAGDRMDAMTAREDFNRTLSSVDFKGGLNINRDDFTSGTLGIFGNRSARKRRQAKEEATQYGPETGAGAGLNLGVEDARTAAQEAAGSTAEPAEQPEPTSSPEGNEGIKTTGGPTGAINIPTPPKVPDTPTQGGGGISEGDYKLTKI